MIPCDHCQAPAVHHAPALRWDKERQHRCDKHREHDLSQQKHLAMSTLPIGLQRLTQLADHLEKGQLGHDRFDINHFNNTGSPECGTSGCAIGECPAVWPTQWRWSRAGLPLYGTNRFVWGSTTAFFSLDINEASHLFSAHEQLPAIYGGKYLNDTATRHDVAANIRAFIAIKAATTAFAPTDSEGAE